YSGEGLNYQDALIVMCDSLGKVLWAKRYSTAGRDQAKSVVDCAAGLIVCGRHNNGLDGFVMVVDYTGTVKIDQSYPNSDFKEVKCTGDGGFVVVGESIREEKI
ncbi:unnamed protein product, partial [Ectocarpus fasciculatus]